MKNLLKVVFAVILVFGLAIACSKKEEPAKDQKTDAAKEAPVEQKTEAKTENQAPSNEIDELISEYEKFMEEYIAITVKAKGGDKDAAQQLNKYAEQATKFGAQLAPISEQLTPEQAKKLADIQKKYQDAYQQALKK